MAHDIFEHGLSCAQAGCVDKKSTISLQDVAIEYRFNLYYE